MILSTVSVLASTRATLYIAGFVESVCNLMIVPRLAFATGLDIAAGDSQIVADAVEESNLANGYTISAWSLNTSQLCDGNQVLAPVVDFDPSATNSGRCCSLYTVDYVGNGVPLVSLVVGTGAQTVGANSCRSCFIEYGYSNYCWYCYWNSYRTDYCGNYSSSYYFTGWLV